MASTFSVSGPEPWLRGALDGVHPLIMPALFSFEQVREDLARHTASLSAVAVWRDVNGTSLGFHLKHIAGSVDRLTTYLAGRQLTTEQLLFLERESTADQSLDELLTSVASSLRESEQQLRRLDPNSIYDPRTVGRKALPTTVIGLLIHLCEHTQRHLGQVITIAKLLR